MSGRPKAWLDGVIGHYGSLDAFPDARTVRIMLQFCDMWIADDDGFMNSIHKSELENWKKTFAEDRAEYTAVKTELEAWLTKRGLTR